MALDPAAPIPPTVAGTVREQFQELATSAADADNHGVALDALRELSKKPGWQTTEFYLSLALGAFGAVLTQMPGKELVGALLSAAAVLSYNLSRGVAKKAAGLLLACALSLAVSGCSSSGMIAAENATHAVLLTVGKAITAAQADPTLIPAALDAVAALDAQNAKLASISNQLKGSITTGRLEEAQVVNDFAIGLVTAPKPSAP